MGFDKSGPIKIFRNAQGSSAQRCAIGRQIHGVQDQAVIGTRGHHPRQAQKRKRRVVRVTTQAQTQRLGAGGNFRQKIDQMRSKLRPCDALVAVQ